MLGLKYPGGPQIEKLAEKSKQNTIFNLPRPLINDNTMNLSFSGLKTSVRRIIESENQINTADLALSSKKVLVTVF